VIGLGLDLALRDRSDGRVTLDDFMRALWEKYGRPGTRMPGYVETPYTLADLQSVLAAVANDAAFADDFFARYIHGREVVDFKPLLANAGFLLRLRAAGRAYAGALQTQDVSNGLRVTGDVPLGSPAYAAGLERDDVIVSIGGSRMTVTADLDRALATRKPGDLLQIVYERRGERITSILTLVEDPTLELVPAEEAGQTLSDAQKKYRDAWLGSAARAL
jgi:predicted metalloprotease with PDZ domain